MSRDNAPGGRQKEVAPRRGPMGGHGGPMGAAMNPTEKAKDFKRALGRLIGYLRPHMAVIIIVFILAAASTVFTIFGPKIQGEAISELYRGFMAMAMGVPGAAIDFGIVGFYLLVVAGLYGLSSVFSFIQSRLMAGVTQKTVYRMRGEVDQKLNRLPLSYYDKNQKGEILSRVVNDIDNIQNVMQMGVTQAITSIVTVIGVFIMMLTISPIISLICLVIIPLAMLITTVIVKKSQKFFASQWKLTGELNGHIEEMYTGHKVVKLFGQEAKVEQQFDGINEELFKASFKAQFVSGIIMPLMNFINNLSYVFVCVIGGVMVINQTLLIGDVQAFIQYTRSFTQPLAQMANITNTIQSAVASAERVFELLNEAEQVPDPADAAQLPTVLGDVRFAGVDFSYDPEVPLIKGMDIDIKAGQNVAIVGPTGAGKTTLVNLLMRFYDIDAGRVAIDGQDINAMKREDLRRIFGMVLQDTWLFAGTIRDNIAYGKPGATDDEIKAAAKAAYIHHFIKTLPDGYNSLLTEDASNISQGQKQLLTIARAVLADPRIMILDEATSSVDTRTEVLIQRAMKGLMSGRTSFIIAHRLSTIKNADLILVMDGGTIIEQGTHVSLMEKGGFYCDLYNSQFRGPAIAEANGLA